MRLMSDPANKLMDKSVQSSSSKGGQLEFVETPFSRDSVQPAPLFIGEHAINDWRCCQDGSWGNESPRTFKNRTTDLTKNSVVICSYELLQSCVVSMKLTALNV